MAVQKRIIDKFKTTLMETPLDALARELLAEDFAEPTSAEARAWLLARAREINTVSATALFRDSERYISNLGKIIPGRMYLFTYDPEGKATLPYYDRIPLVFPIEKYIDGFLGINFHYLHPKFRSILLDRLKVFRNNSKYNETTRLKMNYNMVTSFARLNLVQPTLHRYKYRRFRSRVLWIQPEDWDVALALPCERFVGEKKYKVYKESRDKVIHP